PTPNDTRNTKKKTSKLVDENTGSCRAMSKNKRKSTNHNKSYNNDIALVPRGDTNILERCR
ncbi:2219_t:CDS:2, partial [Gigaspora rosea]